MTTVQPASERTLIEKIAARTESRSARLLSRTGAATGVESSACSSLGIVRSVSCQLYRDAAGPEARTGCRWTRCREEDTESGRLRMQPRPVETLVVAGRTGVTRHHLR
jgi:hypothetical protein